MRLLDLAEHSQYFDLYKTMWQNFLREQQMVAHQGEGRTIFLIEEKGDIVGFCEIALEEECNPDEDMPELCLKVYGFYILPEKRHHELGRDAFKLMRQWGRDNKAALLEVEVSKVLKFSNDFLKEQGLELAGSGQTNIWRGFN